MPLPGSAITGSSDGMCALCSVFCGLCWHVLSAEACTFVTLTTDQDQLSVMDTQIIMSFMDTQIRISVSVNLQSLWSAQAVFFPYWQYDIALWLAQFLQQDTPPRSSGINCGIHLPQARNMRLNIVSCCKCRLCIYSAQSYTMAVCSNPLCLV